VSNSRVVLLLISMCLLHFNGIAQVTPLEDYSARTYHYANKHFINDQFTACKNRKNGVVSCHVLYMQIDAKGVPQDSALEKYIAFAPNGFTVDFGRSRWARWVIDSIPKDINISCDTFYIPKSSPDTTFKYQHPMYASTKVKEKYDEFGYLKSQALVDRGLWSISWAGGGNTHLTYKHDSLGNLLYKGRSFSHFRWFGKPWKEMFFTYHPNGNMKSKTIKIGGKKRERSIKVYHYHYNKS